MGQTRQKRILTKRDINGTNGTLAGGMNHMNHHWGHDGDGGDDNGGYDEDHLESTDRDGRVN